MYEIILTQGKVALVSRQDYYRLKRYKWCAHCENGEKWYALRREGRKLVRMHREILVANDSRKVDHRNGNGLDNRRSNLRIASQQSNVHNQIRKKNNTSGYKGVSWNSRNNNWNAYIWLNYKKRHLGVFTCPIEAAKAYDKAARKLHGRFARLNFP